MSTKNAAASKLPTIRLKGGQLPQSVDRAENALLAAGLNLYQRGGAIVRPVKSDDAPTADGYIPALRLLELGVPALVEAMTRAVHWMARDNRSQLWIPTDCPRQIAETYLSRLGLWKLPALAGVVYCPMLRRDGSLLNVPGYDQSTGILFEPNGITFPPIPDQPTREDAVAALKVLRDLLREFPFVAGHDAAVALSAILTAVIRPSLSLAPLHGFTAAVAGSGKSTLVDVVSMIATGRPARVIAQGKSAAELEKRLGALLMEGDPFIAFDNCEEPLGGDLLCQALTQSFLKVRPLGRSVTLDVPNNAAIFATGNNLKLAGDMTRRALLCSLDPGIERPELRQFDNNPISILRQQRGEYVAAAVTILLAYHVAGRPRQADQLASFGEWSRWVRDALLWLGEADPCETMNKVRDADPTLSALTAVIEQWYLHFADRRVSAREVIEAATNGSAPNAGAPQSSPGEFQDALLAVAGDGSVINPRRLGKWLATSRDRVIGGHKIMADGSRSGVAFWKVIKIGATGAGQDTSVS